MLQIDGTHGEGGGQILRSSLTLSLVTGRPFRITGVRGGRRKPGLLRQHLACVRLAAAVGRAEVEGASLGSQALTFRPTALQPGDYTEAVGSAGSALLVLQTVLPALAVAGGPSSVTVEGGTHNPWSPCFDFLSHAWAPQVRALGASLQLTLAAHGFFPAGGGRVSASIAPTAGLQPLVQVERPAACRTLGAAVVSGLPENVGHRERKVLLERLGPEADLAVVRVQRPRGPGNRVWVADLWDGGAVVSSAAGRRGVTAEEVAARAADGLLAARSAGLPVGPHLADQLVLLLALGGGGRFRTGPLTPHTRTNLWVVGRFVEAPPLAREVRPGVWEVTG